MVHLVNVNAAIATSGDVFPNGTIGRLNLVDWRATGYGLDVSRRVRSSQEPPRSTTRNEENSMIIKTANGWKALDRRDILRERLYHQLNVTHTIRTSVAGFQAVEKPYPLRFKMQDMSKRFGTFKMHTNDCALSPCNCDVPKRGLWSPYSGLWEIPEFI
jgi:hypothetical protein